MISGELMFVIMIAAIVTALTPSTIGVLIQLCSVVLGAGNTKVRMVLTGIAFTGALFVTSLLIGLCALWLLSVIPMIPATYMALGAGILIVYAGLIEIKDYFWYGRGFGLRMHTKSVRRIKQHQRKSRHRPRTDTWLIHRFCGTAQHGRAIRRYSLFAQNRLRPRTRFASCYLQCHLCTPSALPAPCCGQRHQTKPYSALERRRQRTHAPRRWPASYCAGVDFAFTHKRGA